MSVDSIRHGDQAMQRLLRAVEHAHSLITFAGVLWTIEGLLGVGMMAAGRFYHSTKEGLLQVPEGAQAEEVRGATLGAPHLLFRRLVYASWTFLETDLYTYPDTVAEILSHGERLRA